MSSRATIARTVAAVTLVLTGASLSGQSTSPALSLAEARALALKNHPRVQAAEALSLRADQITREVRSAYYPALNGEITGAQANLNSRLGAGVLNDPRLFNHAGAGLSLTQLITDSGRTSNLAANAKLESEASREDVRASQYDAVLGVDQAYYDVLLAQQLVKVAEETVAARQTVVDQVSELFKNKLKSQVDVSFAQVNFSDASLMLLRAKDRLTSAYASLGQALGTDQAVEYQLSDSAAPPNPPDNPDALIVQALKQRPELASLRLQQEAGQKFVNAERDLKRPTVNLMAVGGALPYIDPGNANANIPQGYEAIGVNVQIPLFNGHLFSARRQAAEYQLQATNQRTREIEERIARDVRTALGRAKTSFEAIAATQQLLDQANLALNLAQGRYNLGLSSIVELTQAQLGQTQAEVENVNAKYDYAEAYDMLRYTLGDLRQ